MQGGRCICIAQSLPDCRLRQRPGMSLEETVGPSVRKSASSAVEGPRLRARPQAGQPGRARRQWAKTRRA